ncbi:ATP-dependent DNA helicase RecG [Candidatus Terasakiella magnetica]|uniref:ATP-dependent DNA helicase RecG n=1 Tax=Candidatus Terasakiella magnetica TaxID=1867952 RepID=A0A1C3RC69_9PROT|nr:ATP-dependent DNA helicase RecG [Candidatus Terasakiella magnetica]SCA54812.1 ATP-dependent DNA helicase RecG [Candidatus Terasakiella magnetica]
MRPEILFPLFRPITALKGVGPRISKLMEKITGEHIVDVMWHLPTSFIDRRFSPTIAEAPDNTVVTLEISVAKHFPSRNRRAPYKISCFDETGPMDLVFFNARGDYLKKQLPEGETRIISGTVERFQGILQMTHPDRIGKIEEKDEIQTVDPVYALTAGVTNKTMGKAIRSALDHTEELTEWLDPAFKKQKKWPDWQEALTTAHHPKEEEDLFADSPARERLAYDELLANQLALALVRRTVRRAAGRPITGDGKLRQEIRNALPFDLTDSQENSLEEIKADMAEPLRMLRLLQGDVGSGKTVVALLTALIAIEAGMQAVIMAPTEILARQHMETIEPLLVGTPITPVILTGRNKGKKRTEILERIASGEAQLAIGTHALFQDDVEFANLGLAVIDEQHRFGVHQRLALAGKGQHVDVLVMTATPIPRTLMLTAYGDMDVSRLTEKPAGRKPVDTRVMSLSKMEEVAQGIGRMVSKGARIYWVCPLVEESDKIEIAAAQERFEHLQSLYGARVGLVHGKMKGTEKDAVMAAFASGEIDVLVATTVIEVGVNVPEATVMIIEHAERFGLAQLHQLRGRIGRGMAASTCLLLYGAPLSENGQARLKIMRETEDGFIIAEEDLRLRGAGEVLGTRQSGLPEFKLAQLPAHEELLAAARDDVKLILDKDPELQSPRGQALRTLLYLFEEDATVGYLRSG